MVEMGLPFQIEKAEPAESLKFVRQMVASDEVSKRFAWKLPVSSFQLILIGWKKRLEGFT